MLFALFLYFFYAFIYFSQNVWLVSVCVGTFSLCWIVVFLRNTVQYLTSELQRVKLTELIKSGSCLLNLLEKSLYTRKLTANLLALSCNSLKVTLFQITTVKYKCKILTKSNA